MTDNDRFDIINSKDDWNFADYLLEEYSRYFDLTPGREYALREILQRCGGNYITVAQFKEAFGLENKGLFEILAFICEPSNQHKLSAFGKGIKNTTSVLDNDVDDYPFSGWQDEFKSQDNRLLTNYMLEEGAKFIDLTPDREYSLKEMSDRCGGEYTTVAQFKEIFNLENKDYFGIIRFICNPDNQELIAYGKGVRTGVINSKITRPVK